MLGLSDNEIRSKRWKQMMAVGARRKRVAHMWVVIFVFDKN